MKDDLTVRAVAWYDANARDLPWRRAGVSAWAVLVSEVMLQQTPVARVEPIWLEWLARWPDAATLALAAPSEVIRAWGRLGYPRRALRLQACAATLVEQFDGEVPDDVNALLGLPGVGAYTARAVAAFAFGRRHPVVDVNVRRVVARAVLGRAEPGPASSRRDLADVEALLPVDEAAAAKLSIALMELGALICTARSPACSTCPLLPACAWQRAGCPPFDGDRARPQRFVGTDRQVRGLLMAVLRDAAEPVDRARIDLVWPEPVQLERALAGLVDDGLAEARPDRRYALPGHDRRSG